MFLNFQVSSHTRSLKRTPTVNEKSCAHTDKPTNKQTNTPQIPFSLRHVELHVEKAPSGRGYIIMCIVHVVPHLFRIDVCWAAVDI